MTKRATTFGFIILIAIYIFGTFCCYDLVRQFNLTSKVLGYFQHSTSVTKINDFEYDITNLLFTNSGANENEYFAEVITTPVEGFDKNKNYTLKINDINATRVYGNYSYINVELMNKFYSTQDTLILTDILNIKVNFYTDGTKIVFITKNGESAVKLWTSYIQKNGFNIKIVEDKFNSTIDADNIPQYTINLYAEDVLVQTLNFTSLTFNDITLPTTINNKPLLNWRDSEGNIKTKENLTLQSINLYAEFPIDYTVNLFVGEELYQTLTINESNQKNFYLPYVVNDIAVNSWKDAEGNIYDNIPLKNINLYADITVKENSTTFILGDGYSFYDEYCEPIKGSCEHKVTWDMEHLYGVESQIITFNEEQQNLFNKLDSSTGSVYDICKISNVNILIQNMSFNFKDFETGWYATGSNNARLYTDLIYLGYIDEENNLISIFELQFYIRQKSINSFQMYITIHKRTTAYTQEVYKKCVIGNEKLTLVDKVEFENLDNSLEQACLNLNKIMSVTLTVELTNE